MIQSSIQATVEKLREKLIQTALDSPEFRELLKETVSIIVNYSRSAANEASVESSFDRELYSLLKNIGITLQLEKQIAVDTRRHVGRGRMDSRIGAVVIEYKHREKLETDCDVAKATDQLKDYLLGLSQTKPSVYYGFLTDGLKCKEIILENNSVTSESAPVRFTEIEALRLIKNVVLLEKSALSPENLIKDFCNSSKNNLVYDMSRTFFDILKSKPTKKTRMLKTEWEQLFRLGHNDRSQQKMIVQREHALETIIGKKFADGDQYTALFALQTAYAIIIKLIAYRIISEIRFEKPLKSYHSILKADETSMRIFCAGLEDGEIFRDLGIVNLLEGDFFSWYSDPEQWTTTIASYVRNSLQILARYENATEIFKTEQVIDLFKGLYETIMPQVVRSSLGEFYTPSWLTEHIFKCVKPKGRWRGLDPCAGSGTFVLTMIREVLAETAHETKEHQL